jgi:hypothetical protein
VRGAPAAKVIAELFGRADGMSRDMKVRLCATCSGAVALERSAPVSASARNSSRSPQRSRATGLGRAT